MNIEWKYIKPLKELTAVRDYLIENEINLPEQLIEMIEKNNGGRPSDKQILTPAVREYVFKSLLSYNKEDKETVYDIYSNLFINSTLYPLGSDAAGNFVCYDVAEGKLKLYNHETDKTEDIIKMPALLVPGRLLSMKAT